MEKEVVIAAKSLTRRFGDVVAVDDLTLEIYAGEIFGFLGHNGAGKTTTVRLLNGILTASSGVARVLGLDPAVSGPVLRQRTGVLTETPSLDERLTGRENLEIYAQIYGVPQAGLAGRVTELLRRAELADRADEKVGHYSRGMKQRLALARALLHEPQILFLDEPTAGLDPVATRRVHELVARLSHEERRTVFMCTHNLAEAQKLCDRVAVLEHGRLVALGTPTELARQVGRSLRLEIEVAPDGLPAALKVLQTYLFNKPGEGGVCADGFAVRTHPTPQLSKRYLQTGFGHPEPEQQGNTISVVGVDGEMVPELVARLVAAEVRIYRVAPQEPSLESVYFALHGEQEEAS